MALNLNLLHEEISEHRQRQRDPLKLGMMFVGAVTALLVAYYLWNAYKLLLIKGRLHAVQSEWAKVEPKVTAAQKRAAELTQIIDTTRVLDGFIDGRFYWAPLLENISRCVAPNNRLTSIEGSVLDEKKGVSVTVEGEAAGREPRAAAEDLRQLLLEQLSQHYGDVKVEFRTLEDLDTIVNVAGNSMEMSRYVLNVTFNPASLTTGKAAVLPIPATTK
ncbi:MAG: hypothetical protein ABJB22_06675 [Verrucomicrobiota bacterium]